MLSKRKIAIKCSPKTSPETIATLLVGIKNRFRPKPRNADISRAGFGRVSARGGRRSSSYLLFTLSTVINITLSIFVCNTLTRMAAAAATVAFHFETAYETLDSDAFSK